MIGPLSQAIVTEESLPLRASSLRRAAIFTISDLLLSLALQPIRSRSPHEIWKVDTLVPIP